MELQTIKDLATVSKCVDTSADGEGPIIVLSGPQTVTILVYQQYNDPGAFAYTGSDALTPIYNITVQGLPIDTSLPSLVGNAHVITYTVRDPRTGKTASTQRWVNVVDPCPASERFCPETQSCSQGGQCVAGGAVRFSIPEFDRDPPVLKLDTTGRQVLSPTGSSLGVATDLLVGSIYQEPGYSAFDSVDGNVTDMVAICGLDTVQNLDTPTLPGQPLVLAYTASDRSGNAAPAQYRLVYVTCPEGEFICQGDGAQGDAPRSCSYAGVCGTGLLPLQSALGRLAIPTLPRPRGLPIVTLLGPDRYSILQGQPYDKCMGRLSGRCDRGATAIDSYDNADISQNVVACLANAPAGLKPEPFVDVGLKYCRLNTSEPGPKIITFSVPYGTGYTVNVSRTVIVNATCNAGDEACDNGICAPKGGCPMPSGQPQLRRALPSPPMLKLITTPVVPEIVKVPQGLAYVACKSGQVPLPNLPCEPGAKATNADNDDISEDVLICAPDNCLDLDLCEGHQFKNKGGNLAQFCNISTATADVGTSMSLTFIVYDTLTGLSTSKQRIIQVIDPCGEHRYTCDGICSDVPCTTSSIVQNMSAPLNQPPLLTLVLPPSTVNAIPVSPSVLRAYRLNFGIPGLLDLWPCANATSSTNCAAIAQDAEDGDITSRINVTDVTPCPGGSCATCLPASLFAGLCLPGTYLLQYAVTDTAGLSASAVIQISIQELYGYMLVFDVDSGAPSLDAALTVAGDLLTNPASGMAMARAYIPFITNSISIQQVVQATLLSALPQPQQATLLPLRVTLNIAVASALPNTPYVIRTPTNATQVATVATVTNSTSNTTLASTLSSGVRGASNTTGNTVSQGRRLLSVSDDSSSSPPALLNAPLSTASLMTVLGPRYGAVRGSWNTWHQNVGTAATHLKAKAGDAKQRVQFAEELLAGTRTALDPAVQQLEAALPEAAELADELEWQARSARGSSRRRLLQLGTTCDLSFAPNLTLAMKGPGDGPAGLGGIVSMVSSPLVRATSCVTRQPSEADLSLSKFVAVLSSTSKQAAVLSQQLVQLGVSVGGIFDAIDKTDDAIAQQWQLAVTDSKDLVDAMSSKLMVVEQMSDRLLALLNATLPALQQSLNQADTWSSVTSLQNTLATFVTTAIVLEGLGLANPSTYTPGDLQYVQALYARAVNGRFYFNVNSLATRAPSVDGSPQRRLLQLNTVELPGGDDPGRWDGYVMPTGQALLESAISTRSSSIQMRTLGSSMSNTILVGMFINQVRRSMKRDLDTILSTCASVDGKFRDLAVACSKAWQDNARRMAANSTDELKGLGVDPVFDTKSALFTPELVPDIGNYYNVTAGSPEMSPSGLPYGFFAHEVGRDYPLGYPVLLSSQVTNKRMNQLLTYLKDAPYLSATDTESLTAELPLYNPHRSVLGYVKISMLWEKSGVIRADTSVSCLPAIAYQGEIRKDNWQRFLPDLAFILVSIVYVILSVWDVLAYLKAKRKLHMDKDKGMPLYGTPGDIWEEDERRKLQLLRPQKSMTVVGIEVLTCGLIIAAMTVFFVYTFHFTPKLELYSKLQAYDADASAPARYFLTTRDENPDSPAAQQLAQYGPCTEVCLANELNLATIAPAKSVVFTNTTTNSDGACYSCLSASKEQLGVFGTESGYPLPASGMSQRWRLPAGQDGLRTMAEMLGALRSMQTLYVAYAFLQSLLLMTFIGRLISLMQCQPRLAIIPKTLVLILPDILHLLLVMACIITMIGMACVMAFGDLSPYFASAGEAILGVVRRVQGDSAVSKAVHGLLAGSLDRKNGGQIILAWAINVVYIWMLLMSVTMPFILAVVLIPYSKLRQAAASFPSALQDITDRMEWVAQAAKGAPNNKHIKTVLKLLMAMPDAQQTRLLMKLKSKVATTMKGALDASKLGHSFKGGKGAVSEPGVPPTVSSKKAFLPQADAKLGNPQNPRHRAIVGLKAAPGAVSQRQLMATLKEADRRTRLLASPSTAVRSQPVPDRLLFSRINARFMGVNGELPAEVVAACLVKRLGTWVPADTGVAVPVARDLGPSRQLSEEILLQIAQLEDNTPRFLPGGDAAVVVSVTPRAEHTESGPWSPFATADLLQQLSPGGPHMSQEETIAWVHSPDHGSMVERSGSSDSSTNSESDASLPAGTSHSHAMHAFGRTGAPFNPQVAQGRMVQPLLIQKSPIWRSVTTGPMQVRSVAQSGASVPVSSSAQASPHAAGPALSPFMHLRPVSTTSDAEPLPVPGTPASTSDNSVSAPSVKLVTPFAVVQKHPAARVALHRFTEQARIATHKGPALVQLPYAGATGGRPATAADTVPRLQTQQSDGGTRRLVTQPSDSDDAREGPAMPQITPDVAMQTPHTLKPSMTSQPPRAMRQTSGLLAAGAGAGLPASVTRTRSVALGNMQRQQSMLPPLPVFGLETIHEEPTRDRNGLTFRQTLKELRASKKVVTPANLHPLFGGRAVHKVLTDSLGQSRKLRRSVSAAMALPEVALLSRTSRPASSTSSTPLHRSPSVPASLMDFLTDSEAPLTPVAPKRGGRIQWCGNPMYAETRRHVALQENPLYAMQLGNNTTRENPLYSDALSVVSSASSRPTIPDMYGLVYNTTVQMIDSAAANTKLVKEMQRKQQDLHQQLEEALVKLQGRKQAEKAKSASRASPASVLPSLFAWGRNKALPSAQPPGRPAGAAQSTKGPAVQSHSPAGEPPAVQQPEPATLPIQVQPSAAMPVTQQPQHSQLSLPTKASDSPAVGDAGHSSSPQWSYGQQYSQPSSTEGSQKQQAPRGNLSQWLRRSTQPERPTTGSSATTRRQRSVVYSWTPQGEDAYGEVFRQGNTELLAEPAAAVSVLPPGQPTQGPSHSRLA